MNLSREIEEYVIKHSEEEDDILNELSRKTNIQIYHPRQISGALQGTFLNFIVSMLQPDRILEIGTFTGYSAICMARALNSGSELITIEANDELSDFAGHYIERAGLKDKITTLTGDARKIIPQLDGYFDLVFIDAEKNEYIEYYDLVFDKVRDGGFILADNVLWSGKVVLEKLDNNDYFTKGIKEFNDYIKKDIRVEKMILPFRDGLMLIRKKKGY